MANSTNGFESFVGVDLHKCTLSLAAVNPSGETIERLKVSTKCLNRISDWIEALPQPCHLAVEACPFTEWFIDFARPILERHGGRIDIADATELANLRGKRRKTDRNDALDVARRLARGECPLGFIADEQLMHLRKLGRHWRRLSRNLSRCKHGMKSILNAANIRGPRFDGASAQRWLLAHGQRLRDADRMAFSDLLDLVQLIERQRQSLRYQIILANRDDRFVETVTRLKTVPGIDEIWGCIIAAEIGPFDRFPNADALEFWAGLTPDNQESAGRTQSGSITKAGSAALRWALCNAALVLCRSDAKQEAIRQRLIARVGKAKANVAMGRRLLRILYAMMRDRSSYRVGQPTAHTAKANRARTNKGKRSTRKAA